MSFLELSSVVNCVTSPSVAEIRNRPPEVRPKIITPSRLQAPPKGAVVASQSVCTVAPVTSIFLSRASAKKPMKRLSGAQKEPTAPCVPGSALASFESNACTQSWILPPVHPVKARRRPSGDTANGPKLVLSGGSMENLVTRASLITGWRVKYANANPNTPNNNAAATIQVSRAWPSKRNVLRLSGAIDGTVDMFNCDSSREPDGVDKASSAKPRSLAV